MTRSIPADRYSAITSATALGIMLVLVLLLAGAPLYTEDLWWHLKAGEMYAMEGPWPSGDWMLHTAHADAPVQHEWLFGVSVYELHRLIGFQGLRVAHVLAVAAIFWLAYSLFRRESGWPVAACFATCAFAVFAWFRLFQLRPDLISILATLAAYRLLLEQERPPSWPRVLGFALLIVVWVNFHSLFLISLNLLVAAVMGVALGVILERLFVVAEDRDQGRFESDQSTAVRLAIALILGALVALANPRGVEQHLTFISSSENAAIWHITDEWSHFNPFLPSANHESVSLARWLATDAMLLAFLLASVAGFIRFTRLRTRQALDDFSPVLFGLALASLVALLISIRFMWMSVFPLLYLLHAFKWMRTGAPRVASGGAWMMALASLALAAWFSVGYGFANLVSRFGNDPGEYLTRSFRTHKFHLEGVHFLERSGVEGKLFNSYWMGGFLGYWLTPELRTFIDSRTEHYDDSVYLDYSAVTEMLGALPGESFVDVLDRRDVNLFFGVGFPGWWHSAYTTTHLENIPGWLLVSRSFRHAIYLRDDERNRENLNRIADYYAAEGIPFDVERGLDPSAVIGARPDWAVEHSMLPPEHPELLAEAQSEDARTRLRASHALGLAYLLTGAYVEQVARDLQTAAAYPRDKASRRRLVYGLLRLDDAPEAGRIAGELLRIDPNDRWSRQLVRLARRYAALGEVPPVEKYRVALGVHRNRLLWKAMPTTSIETWTVEHSMRTEELPLPAPGSP